MRHNELGTELRVAHLNTPLLLLTALVLFCTVNAMAQEKPIYSFANSDDGNSPESGLIIDKAGNLYGASVWGGNLPACQGFGCGAIFELKRTSNGRWKESTLYDFSGGTTDGSQPFGPLLLDSRGHLFGTAYYGGSGICDTGGNFATCGVVFELQRNSSGVWSESVLYNFQGGNDGAGPESGLISDQAGNLYGTTIAGGGYSGTGCVQDGCGTFLNSLRIPTEHTPKRCYMPSKAVPTGHFPLAPWLGTGRATFSALRMQEAQHPAISGLAAERYLNFKRVPLGGISQRFTNLWAAPMA
jgi:hypothetical protein